jgi:translation initiation factor IF-3
VAPERDQTRVNERIRIAEIRLIGPDGEQLGVMSPEEGLEHAREHGLDLVEVAPNSRPPVCRIMDYGRYKYEQKKKRAGAHKKSHAATLK